MVDSQGVLLITEASEGILKAVEDFHPTLRVTARDRGATAEREHSRTNCRQQVRRQQAWQLSHSEGCLVGSREQR